VHNSAESAALRTFVSSSLSCLFELSEDGASSEETTQAS
jgi:hypothetical protein